MYSDYFFQILLSNIIYGALTASVIAPIYWIFKGRY